MTLLRLLTAEPRRFCGVFFDIDGTLLVGGRLCPGADRVLKELREINFPHYLLTNDGNHSLEEKSGFLRKAGLCVQPHEIISCSSALAPLAAARGWKGKKFFILGELGAPCFAEAAHLRTTRNEAELGDCDGVIVGEGYYDWHNHMQAAINFFRNNPEAPMVVPNPDTYWPGRNKTVGVGSGGQARFICQVLAELGVHIEPIYLGKPYAAIYELARNILTRRFALPEPPAWNRLMMVGDSLQSDIQGGKALNMFSVLVLTGVGTRKMAEEVAPAFRPDMILENL